MSNATPQAPEAATDPNPTENRLPWPIVGASGVGLVLLLWWGWTVLRPRPELGPAMNLYAKGRYPEAQRKLADYLAADPTNPDARLALADTLMNLDPPRPAEVLKTLESFKPTSPAQSASAMVLRGKAEQALDHPSRAEADWKEALRRDPLVGEAGWLLLQLYYIEGRTGELRELALKLHKNEPEPHDRVRLLLEAMRPDAEPLAAAGVIPAFKNAVKANPDDTFAALAYYRALAKDGTGIDEAIGGLKGLVQRHPSDPACLDGLLFAMAKVGDLEGMGKALEGLPKEVAADRRFARYRGLLAENARDPNGAIAFYKTALEIDPSDREILHRLGESQKLANKTEDAEKTKSREADIEAARVELRGIKGQEAQEGKIGLFEDAMSRPNFGKNPDLSLYKSLAAIRERMGHPDEARAWHKLVLREAPEDAASLEAVGRLEGSRK